MLEVYVDLCFRCRGRPSYERTIDFAPSINGWEDDNANIIMSVNNFITHSINA